MTLRADCVSTTRFRRAADTGYRRMTYRPRSPVSIWSEKSIWMEPEAYSVLTAGLDRAGTRAGRHRRVVAVVEEAVEKEREADDDEKAANSEGG